jgi:hypothetical protein
MSNKRTFDEMESDSMLDMLSIELLLHMIVVSDLSNIDITHLAMLNKSYRDTLNDSKDYLRKRGYWTICVKRSEQPVSGVCCLNIEATPIIPFGFQRDGRDWEDVLLTTYRFYDARFEITRLIAIYPDTLNVKWVHDVHMTKIYHSVYVGLVGSAIALIDSGSEMLRRVNVADGRLLEEVELPRKNVYWHDITQWYRTPPTLVLNTSSNVRGESDKWIVTAENDKIKILDMTVPKTHTLRHCASDYLVIEEGGPYVDDPVETYIVRYSPDETGKRLKLNIRSDSTIIEGNEAIVQSGIYMLVVDLTASSPDKLVYKEDFMLPRDETWIFSDIAAKGDIMLFNGGVYDNNDGTRTHRLGWYTRSMQRWKTGHLITSSHNKPLHTIKETGVIWAWGGHRDNVLYRYNPDGTVEDMGDSLKYCTVCFVGSFKNTTFVYLK